MALQRSSSDKKTKRKKETKTKRQKNKKTKRQKDKMRMAVGIAKVIQ